MAFIYLRRSTSVVVPAVGVELIVDGRSFCMHAKQDIVRVPRPPGAPQIEVRQQGQADGSITLPEGDGDVFVMLAAAKEPVPYFDAVHMTLTQTDPFPVDEAQDASTRPAREPANSRLLIVAGAVLYIVAIVLAPRFLPLPVIVLVSLFSAGLMASGLARSRGERDRRRAEK